jgi:hypothetical protein
MPFLPGQGQRGFPGRNLRIPVPLYKTLHTICEIFRSKYLNYDAHHIPEDSTMIQMEIPDYLAPTIKELIYLFTVDKTTNKN